MDSKCNHNINNNINNINYHLQLMETFEISFLFKNNKLKLRILYNNSKYTFFFILFTYYVFAIILFIFILAILNA